MNVTKDVINDLLPAYISGEVSADTRTLIEEMAAREPAIARLVESARRERHEPLLHQPIAVPPDLERESVRRTRALLHRRSWVLAFAVLCTLLPFTFLFRDGQVTFLLMRDEPSSRVFWVGGAALWFVYVLLGWRLRID